MPAVLFLELLTTTRPAHFLETFSPSIKNGSVASLVLNCTGLNEKSNMAFTEANRPAPAARI